MTPGMLVFYPAALRPQYRRGNMKHRIKSTLLAAALSAMAFMVIAAPGARRR